MGGNDEKGMTLCLLTCNITSILPWTAIWNNRVYYYRARSLRSLWRCCRSQRPGSEAQKPGMPTKALSHESSAKMWHFTENWEWINEKVCSWVTCIACREQVSQGTADLQNSNREAERKGVLQINLFAPEGVCICSAPWTDVATYQFTEISYRS